MTGVMLDDFELDLDCYKVRLGLALLDIDYVKVPVNRYPPTNNAPAEVPILRNGDQDIRGAEEALQYLANRFASDTHWAPTESPLDGHLASWLEFSASTFCAVTTARDIALYSTEPLDEFVRAARGALQKLDDHLALQRISNHWVVGPQPTIADIALFPAAALTRDIGIDRGTYPALRWWLRRMQALPGFIVMPGIPVFP
jgi:glutathione S-transferase